MTYEIFRAFHIIAIIAWMAAMLILPRLLVYRMETSDGQTARTMDQAARRLVTIILTPSMIAAWVTGLALLGHRFGMSNYPSWLWSKLILVVGMTALHGIFTRWRRLIAADKRPVSARTMRLINEIPFVFAVIVVFAVVLEP